jgi:hypothetical protein
MKPVPTMSQPASPRLVVAGFKASSFGVALGLGIGSSILLAAFALHASLFFASFNLSQPVYWAAGAVYLVLGLALSLLLVPWHRLRIRGLVVVGLILAAIIFGATRA